MKADVALDADGGIWFKILKQMPIVLRSAGDMPSIFWARLVLMKFSSAAVLLDIWTRGLDGFPRWSLVAPVHVDIEGGTFQRGRVKHECIECMAVHPFVAERPQD
eukprot:symbB.v1.2.035037.t1/scaffold4636.1/size37078/2